MNEEIAAAYAEYSEARRRLIGLSPCPKCCPPSACRLPGEYILGGDIRRCRRCHGDGFWINWDDDEEDA